MQRFKMCLCLLFPGAGVNGPPGSPGPPGPQGPPGLTRGLVSYVKNTLQDKIQAERHDYMGECRSPRRLPDQTISVP